MAQGHRPALSTSAQAGRLADFMVDLDDRVLDFILFRYKNRFIDYALLMPALSNLRMRRG